MKTPFIYRALIPCLLSLLLLASGCEQRQPQADATAQTESSQGKNLSNKEWPSPESVVPAKEAGFDPDGIAKLNQAMEKIVDDKDVAGMVWLLAKEGKVAAFEAHGVQSVDTNAPMTHDTLFRIYSMTKPITGVALMILHEEGKWDFDDPITKFIPELADLQVMTAYDDEGEMTLEPMKRPPTMRELLNHSAGFGYGLSGNDPVNKAFRDQAVLNSKNLDDMMAKIKDIPLLYQPGEQWRYSVAVDIQGYIVQKLSGQRFGEFLRQRIFEPLAMTETQFYVTSADRPRFADVHSWDANHNKLKTNPVRPDRPNYLDPERMESGGGGLVSTTHDYARFLQMLVNEGELDGERILSAESVKTMRTNSLADGVLLGTTDTRPGSPGVGFGVDFAVIFDPSAAESPQGQGTYYWSGAAGTWFWIDPQQDMFWIGMIQSRGATRPDAANMREIAANAIYEALER